MDAIDRAVMKNNHITDNSNFLNKTWSDFEAECKGKKVVLRGVTNLLKFLWIRCGDKVEIVQTLRKELNKPIALLLDMQGPEVRTGKLEEAPVMLEKGKEPIKKLRIF